METLEIYNIWNLAMQFVQLITIIWIFLELRQLKDKIKNDKSKR